MVCRETSVPEPGISRKDVVLLTFLAILVLCLRGWQLARTEVAARDSIGYIRIAWRLEHESIGDTLRTSEQHPLYPATVLVASWLVRPWLPHDLPRAMQLSSQLASAVASLLLAVAMYFLGRELFNRRIAFFAVLLCQCLPASGRVMGDGLSEPLFLAFATVAFLGAAVGLRRHASLPLAVAGLAGGLAYLTRPEGGLIVAAACLVMLGTWLVPSWRMPAGKFLLCEFALGASALLIAGPYMAAIGGLTVKPTARGILHGRNDQACAADDNHRGTTQAHSASKGQTKAHGPPSVGFGSPCLRCGLVCGNSPILLAVYAPEDAGHLRWGLWALVRSLVTGSFYLGWIPALLGAWRWRHLLRTHPGVWVLLVTMLALSLFLFKVAATLGYLSDRHTLMILVLGSFWLAAGLIVLGEAATRYVGRLWPQSATSRWGREHCWSAGILAMVAIVPLARTLAPLHGDRAGLRQAGEWLAQHVPAGDYVDDPYGWSHYFAGRVFLEGRQDLPHHVPPVHYVVFENSRSKHPRLYVRSEQNVRDLGGQILASWPVDRSRDPAEIHIYAVPGQFPPPLPPGVHLPPFLRDQQGS